MVHVVSIEPKTVGSEHDGELILRYAYLTQDEDGGVDSHRLFVDIGPIVGALPTDELEQLVDVSNQAGANFDFQLPNRFIDKVREQAPELDRAIAETHTRNDVSVYTQELAAVIIGYGRLDELPRWRDYLMGNADHDLADAIRSSRDSETMLGHEPAVIPGGDHRGISP